MSTAPFSGQLMNLEEFFALGEEFPYRNAELQEGRLILNSAVPLHQRAIFGLMRQLADQLPEGWEVLSQSDVILEREFPPTVRQPDVLVTTTATVDSIKKLEAQHVRLAVEVLSPGTKRVDRVLKPVEYAEAGIPHYWVIDLDPPLSLAAYHLAPAFEAYQEAPAVTGEFLTREPFPLRLDLDRLARR
ncbi:Uma2 family endonuclease [Tenggerimyces flavus]|uniref:Uma2 family endonuclease n=1 Tax=Tenggerimyces flavus TaxID=1708749 RepID=A0ABV7Y8B3_9ACTN|nr:Uma2 family endonuclease [Tenggerimyces flavus]MBM7791256.1 Uma2 family endonuclease [Tenggerimyces flavus]